MNPRSHLGDKTTTLLLHWRASTTIARCPAAVVVVGTRVIHLFFRGRASGRRCPLRPRVSISSLGEQKADTLCLSVAVMDGALERKKSKGHAY